MANLKILITGPPGIGKTTIIKKIVRFLKEKIIPPPILIRSSKEIIIIDEIGKMECFSQKFKDFLWDLFSKPNPLLASISLKGNNFIEKIKHLPQVRLMKVSKENRGALVETIINEIFRAPKQVFYWKMRKLSLF